MSNPFRLLREIADLLRVCAGELEHICTFMDHSRQRLENIDRRLDRFERWAEQHMAYSTAPQPEHANGREVSHHARPE
jgi:hypothetical protein